MDKACYRELTNYKYQLTEPYSLNVGMTSHNIDADYIRLSTDGTLLIKEGYAWDGPSGPTRDTLNFMRGSLVHDALYQLIRCEGLPASHKEDADRLLRDICREDGMSRFRSWYVHLAVKLFGRPSKWYSKYRCGRTARITCVP